jgi:hypothetical protein
MPQKHRSLRLIVQLLPLVCIFLSLDVL